MPYLEQHEGLDNFLYALVKDHERYLPIVQFLDNIISETSQLQWFELEQIGLTVAKEMGSTFCTQLRQGMIAALDDGASIRVEMLEPVLEFALLLTRQPKSIKEEHINRLRQAGWSDQTIEDVVGWVAIMQLYSTVDQGLGFGGLPQCVFNEISVGTVQSNGYVESFQHAIEQL